MLKGQPAPDPAGPGHTAPSDQEAAHAHDQTLIEETTTRAGRYLLCELLGAGSMGEVWRGEDPEIGRQVAVKLMRVPAGLTEPRRAEWEQRFMREAHAAGRLSHPGIVPVHDVGKTEDGRPFIVMEIVEGRDLEAIIKQGPAPSPAAVLGWGAQVASALDAAHRRGIVHRDIKPANILIDNEGAARITDFGIARFSESELTREGLFLGSPAYASPEQLRGAVLDGRSDLFSLGSLLYAVLTGVRPFRGDDLPSLAYAICHVEPAPPCRLDAQLPSRCDAVLAKALAKEPSLRYQTGAELSADLRRAIPGASPAESAGPVVGPKAPGISSTWSAGSAKGVAFERQAAAFGSLAAAWLARATLTVIAKSRVLTLQTRQAWQRGWAMGPRVRAAMLAGLIIVLLAVAGGGYTIISQIVETRRETPARKFKKAWKSLVGDIRNMLEEPDSGGRSNGKDEGVA